MVGDRYPLRGAYTDLDPRVTAAIGLIVFAVDDILE
jgi:hypothetical protein